MSVTNLLSKIDSYSPVALWLVAYLKREGYWTFELGHALKSEIIIKYELDCILHGPMFRAMANDPIEEIAETFLWPRQFKLTLKEELEHRCSEILYSRIDKGLLACIRERRMGYDCSVTLISGNSFLLDVIENREELRQGLEGYL